MLAHEMVMSGVLRGGIGILLLAPLPFAKLQRRGRCWGMYRHKWLPLLYLERGRALT